jgi:hypothetical protein
MGELFSIYECLHPVAVRPHIGRLIGSRGRYVDGPVAKLGSPVRQHTILLRLRALVWAHPAYANEAISQCTSFPDVGGRGFMYPDLYHALGALPRGRLRHAVEGIARRIVIEDRQLFTPAWDEAFVDIAAIIDPAVYEHLCRASCNCNIASSGSLNLPSLRRRHPPIATFPSAQQV